MAPPSVNVGDSLASYVLLEQIGMGGMGVVFRAQDTRLNRDVAVKVLTPGAIADQDARRRFRNEAMALSRLNHPNIETVFDFGSQDEIDFLVIEYIPGLSLDVRLTRGPLPAYEVTALGSQLALGLNAAHQKGVVHRDLKPGNLRITPDQRLKILDFGLAKFFCVNVGDDAATTLTQGVAGTLPYMAPEQLRGEPADVRSDIYSAGAVLYEMSTGQRPFPEAGALLVDAILNRPAISPTSWKRHLSPGMEAVIMKALEKDPRRRYQSAADLLSDIERLPVAEDPGKVATAANLFSAPTEALAPGLAATEKLPSTKKWFPALLAALLLLVAVGIYTQRGRIGSVLGGKAAVPAQKFLAVLPFRSVGGDDKDQAFIQGITETVSIKLMQLTVSHPLQMASPGEVHALRNPTAEDARRDLGVNLVLEGSLQHVGGDMRVNLSLVDAGNHRQLRADSVTVPASDPFTLEDQVVDAATRMLEIEFREDEKLERGAQGTANSDAYQLYLRGRGYLQNIEKPEDVDSAISEFRGALKLDPGYAGARAGLGMAYWAKYRSSKDPQWIVRGRQACQGALQISPQLQDGNVCLAVLDNGSGHYQTAASEFEMVLRSDPSNDDAFRGLASAYEHMGSIDQAEKTLKKAIALRPQYAHSYAYLGSLYYRLARYGEGIEQYKKASALSPNNAGYWSSLGAINLASGQYDNALQALQKAIAIRPSFEAYSNLGQTYFMLRRFAEAIPAFEQSEALGPRQIQAYGNLARAYYWYPPRRNLARAEFLRAIDLADADLKVNPDDADAHVLAAQYFAMIGDRKEAARHLKAALRLRPNDPESLYAAGIVHNQLGERKEALEWLRKAVAKGYSPAEMAATIELDSLRNDPGFAALLPPGSEARVNPD